MALFEGYAGQTDKLPLTVQFTDGTGAVTDPTGTPQVRVYYGETPTLKATLNLTKQASLTGFYGAYLDISDRTVYPAGHYVLRWNATVGGVATASTDSMEILAAAAAAGSGAITGAYASEAEIRNWMNPLDNTNTFSSALVAQKAADAAAIIDGDLRAKYDVPFSSPYDATIVLMNIWLAAAYLLEHNQGQPGNENRLAERLRRDYDERVADILSGAVVLTVETRTTIAGGDSMKGAISSTEDGTKTYEWDNDDAPRLRRF